MLFQDGIADWKGREGMDRFQQIKNDNNVITGITFDEALWLIKEIETLRLDNTYLQQRLKREVEK